MKYKVAILALICALVLLPGCSPAEQTNEVAQTEQTVPVETETVEVTEETVLLMVEETAEATEVPVPETAEATAEVTDAVVQETKPVDVTLRENYDVVLEQYRNAILMDSEEFIELYWNWQDLEGYFGTLDASHFGVLDDFWSSERRNQIKKYLDLPNTEKEYPLVNEMILCYMHQYKDEGEDLSQTQNLQYSYCDLDGNGREELIVAKGYGEQRYNIIGFYTLSYGDVPVAVEKRVGNRSHLEMYTDGTICISGSSSASVYSVDYYKLDRHFGCFLDSLCSFTIDDDSPDVDKIRGILDQFSAELIPLEIVDWMPLFAE